MNIPPDIERLTRRLLSRAVAIAMAEGALSHSEAHCVLAVTGFAGPADDSDEPGLVHLACAIRGQGAAHRELHFGICDRDTVRWESVRALLDLAELTLTSGQCRSACDQTTGPVPGNFSTAN